MGEGKGGKIWENGIETCIISCIKRVASPGLMHDAGCLGLVHWDDPEGRYGEGGGRRVYETAKETLTYRTVLWTLGERERVGRFGRMTLKHVKYHV